LQNTFLRHTTVCVCNKLATTRAIGKFQKYDCDPYLLVQTYYLHNTWVKDDHFTRCNSWTLYAHACMIKIVSALCSMVENQQVMTVKQVFAICQPHNGLQVLLKVSDPRQ